LIRLKSLALPVEGAGHSAPARTALATASSEPQMLGEPFWVSGRSFINQVQVSLIQESSCSGFFSPHFSILETKVVGFSPRSSAAPSAPLIFQLAASNASTRLS